MRGGRRLATSLFILLLASPLLVAVVAAHPLGNFSVNRYSRIELNPDQVRLRYVLDLAEIPTLQELRANGITNGRPSAAAHQRLLEQKADQLTAGAQLRLGEQSVRWVVQESALELVPGQAELDTMRVTLTLAAPASVADGTRIEYRDTNYPGRVGWHEIIAQGQSGLGLANSTVPSLDQTNELQAYPDDPTRAPLDVSAASAVIRSGSTSATSDSKTAQPATDGATSARFALDSTAGLIAALPALRGDANPFMLLVAFGVAAGLGALHALEPGHGKTLVGGYLVGSRGTPQQAVLLGLTVTVTHTLGVYALGLITLIAAEYILPERLYPILGMISGLLLVGIGLSLVRARLASALSHPRDRHGHAIAAHAHSHGDHTHADEHGHVHGGGHIPGHGHAHDDAVHSHGGRAHTHTLPHQDGAPVTSRSLLALGISGGLLPCPSALVVLLAAVSLQNVALGLALVAAFSVGLAAVLTGIGLLVVYGGRVVAHTPVAGQIAQWRVVRAVPVISALAIIVAGFAIAAQAARAMT